MDNRSRLLQIALERFSARGYDSVGVQELVNAAGLTKPTLYHYFGSKLGLLTALLETHFAGLNEQVTEAAIYHGDLPLTLNRVARTYFRFALRNQEFYRFQLGLQFAPPESEQARIVTELSRTQFQVLEAMFLRAEADHGNMRGRSRAYAATLLGMVNTYFVLAIRQGLDLDDDLTFRAVHQFMHGIFS